MQSDDFLKTSKAQKFFLSSITENDETEQQFPTLVTLTYSFERKKQIILQLLVYEIICYGVVCVLSSKAISDETKDAKSLSFLRLSA